MAGIGLLHGDDGDAVAAPLGRQPEIHDLGELALQQRDEYLVQRLAEDGRLVRRAARIGAEIDRLFPHRDGGDGEDGERLDGIVVAGVVAVGAFVGVVVEAHVAFQHDFGGGGHLDRLRLAVDKLHLLSAQQTGEMILAQGVRHGRHRAENRAGVRAQHRRRRERLGLLVLPALVMLRPAAMLEPAHDKLVPAQLLHPVDAEIVVVLALARRPARDDERPGDQRPGLVGPAGLDGQTVEVDIVARQHHFLTRCLAPHQPAPALRLHRQDGLGQRDQVQRLAQAPGRLGLLEIGEQFAHLAQIVTRAPLLAAQRHPARHPLDRAEQVDQHRHLARSPVLVGHVLEQKRRAARMERTLVDLRDLPVHRHRLGDAHQVAVRLQPIEEVAQRGIGGHGGSLR